MKATIARASSNADRLQRDVRPPDGLLRCHCPLAPAYPGCVISREHYGRIVRLSNRSKPVSSRLFVGRVQDEPIALMASTSSARFQAPTGRCASEVVRGGPPSTPWQLGHCATDNAAGCARRALIQYACLKRFGARPRRTDRAFALWTGEESGAISESVGYFREAHFRAAQTDRAATGTRPTSPATSISTTAADGFAASTSRATRRWRPMLRCLAAARFTYLGASTLTTLEYGGPITARSMRLACRGSSSFHDPLELQSKVHHSHLRSLRGGRCPDDLKQRRRSWRAFRLSRRDARREFVCRASRCRSPTRNANERPAWPVWPIAAAIGPSRRARQPANRACPRPPRKRRRILPAACPAPAPISTHHALFDPSRRTRRFPTMRTVDIAPPPPGSDAAAVCRAENPETRPRRRARSVAFPYRDNWRRAGHVGRPTKRPRCKRSNPGARISTPYSIPPLGIERARWPNRVAMGRLSRSGRGGQVGVSRRLLSNVPFATTGLARIPIVAVYRHPADEAAAAIRQQAGPAGSGAAETFARISPPVLNPTWWKDQKRGAVAEQVEAPRYFRSLSFR